MDLKDSFGSKIFFHYIIQIFLFLSRSCFHEIKFKGSMNHPRTRHSASTLTRTRNSRRFVNLILCASVGWPQQKKNIWEHNEGDTNKSRYDRKRGTEGEPEFGRHECTFTNENAKPSATGFAARPSEWSPSSSGLRLGKIKIASYAKVAACCD